MNALAEFRALGIDFVSCQGTLDSCTPMGKAMFTIIGAMAELERNLIRERVEARLEYAPERNEEREGDRPAEAHLRPRRSDPTAGVGFGDRENRTSDASRYRDSRPGYPGAR